MFGLNELLDPWPFSPSPWLTTAKQALGPHDMQNKNDLSIVAVEHATRRLHDLSIAGALEFRRPAATFRVVRQLLHVSEDALNKLCSRGRVL